MSLSDKVLFDSIGVVSDVFDWVYERVFEGHEGRFVVAMVLLFTIVGGME